MHSYTTSVRVYLELIPSLSKSVKNLLSEFETGRFSGLDIARTVRSGIEATLKHSVMVFMMTEFEIVCWINYVDQVNLLNLYFNVNEPQFMLAEAKQTLYFIAFSTKNLLNKNKVKNPIQIFCQSEDPHFERNYNLWLF